MKHAKVNKVVIEIKFYSKIAYYEFRFAAFYIAHLKS